MGGLQGWHLLILLAVILLLFGAARLPALAKSVGQSARVFRGEMKQLKDEDAQSQPHATTQQADTPTGTSAADSESTSPLTPPPSGDNTQR